MKAPRRQSAAAHSTPVAHPAPCRRGKSPGESRRLQRLADHITERPCPSASGIVRRPMRQAAGRLDCHPSVGLAPHAPTPQRDGLVSRRDACGCIDGFADAPDDVLRAVVVFMQGRGAARRAAKRVAPRVTGIPRERPRRRRGASACTRTTLRSPRASRANTRDLTPSGSAGRCGRSRSGLAADEEPARSLRPRLARAGAEIVISRRHIRRHGWPEALETLLHEMVHQWQDERRHPIDHGSGLSGEGARGRHPAARSPAHCDDGDSTP